MPSRNVPLAETGRLRLARCVVEDGWPLRWAGRRARSVISAGGCACRVPELSQSRRPSLLYVTEPRTRPPGGSRYRDAPEKRPTATQQARGDTGEVRERHVASLPRMRTIGRHAPRSIRRYQHGSRIVSAVFTRPPEAANTCCVAGSYTLPAIVQTSSIMMV
jgi:hypothetical protein